MNDTINVRMFRMGTGDFFILTIFNKEAQTKDQNLIPFKIMIDCGCIHGSKEDFEKTVRDLADYVDNKIDLLIVTHEHADHINGFEKASEIFETIVFDEVWFSWTENKEDDFANNLRQNHAELQKAVALSAEKLKKVNFSTAFGEDFDKALMIESRNHFVQSLSEINDLSLNQNIALGKPKPTMEDLLREYKVIKAATHVQFLDQGQLIENLDNLKGIRFFILGPPKDNQLLKSEEKIGDGYEKREQKSTKSIAFLDALNFNYTSSSLEDIQPFDNNYTLNTLNSIDMDYKSPDNEWRSINSDWLFSAGNLALRHQTSINNTSLAICIQIIENEKVLLFPGDAEYGNWISWHDGLSWSISTNNGKKKVNAEYLLNNTVFYKVGHHLSQNGTAKQKGLEMMISDDLAAMVTLDFKKINSGWLNTMPNDIVGAELLKKTKGKLFFAGDGKAIFKNIQTKRVAINRSHYKKFLTLYEKFKDSSFIEYEVS